MVDTDNTDPHCVVFNLYPGDTPGSEKNSVIYDVGVHQELNDAQTQAYLLETLRAHVKKYGTLTRLTLSGSGKTNIIQHLSSDAPINNRIYTRDFLVALGALEKELGQPIAKRIVFDSHQTFLNLTVDDIKFYREFAVQHHVRIVGSTAAYSKSTNGYGPKYDAIIDLAKAATDDHSNKKFVVFNFKGEILFANENKENGWNHDPYNWPYYYIDSTQAEAERAIRDKVIRDIGEQEAPLNNQERQVIEQVTDKVRIVPGGNVAITSDGTIFMKHQEEPSNNVFARRWRSIKSLGRTDGYVKADRLHPMEKNEVAYGGTIYNWDVCHLETVVRSFKATTPDLTNLIKLLDQQAGAAAVVLDNQKQVLIAAQNGGYEVVTIGSDVAVVPLTAAKPKEAPAKAVPKK